MMQLLQFVKLSSWAEYLKLLYFYWQIAGSWCKHQSYAVISELSIVQFSCLHEIGEWF